MLTSLPSAATARRIIPIIETDEQYKARLRHEEQVLATLRAEMAGHIDVMKDQIDKLEAMITGKAVQS